MKKTFLKFFINTCIVYTTVALLGCSSGSEIGQSSSADAGFSNLSLDTVQAGKFDTGKMWTFDFPPKKYFKEEYGFETTDEWLDNVRMSALRFATYCSASFVSGDGLVMTNHHCARESVTEVSKEGEDFHTNGFYAEKLSDEKKVPGLFVDQLVKIIDVTGQVQKSVDEGTTDQEKKANKDKAIASIQDKYKKETGFECSVISFYNGGKFSLYCYKRYKDVRLVFAPETQLGFYGGDPDNFTYPRYALDCSFFRVYDTAGNPLKTDHFFKWSPNGAEEGEPVFVVGNPGRTNRLQTVAQLEYQRDISNPITLERLNAIIKVYSELIKEEPSREAKMQDKLFSFANSQKAYAGIQKGLLDPVLMQKKRVFENNFKKAVQANSKLNSIYGGLWNTVASIRTEMKKIGVEYSMIAVDPRFSSKYFGIAQDAIKIANQLKLPEVERKEEFKSDKIAKLIEKIIPDDFDVKLADKLLKSNLSVIFKFLGPKYDFVSAISGGKNSDAVYNDFVKNSPLRSRVAFTELVKKGPDAILNSTDPLIYWAINGKDRASDLGKKMKEMQTKETVNVETLGRALFEVYGTSIPPDATFSLRIADGIVAGYEYNGTEAPPVTTFYGLYDRYYSFNKKAPFNLPERWQKPPADFNLETPMVFVSTNDIIGGNSGSPLINRKAEIVGLAFDGNIESLPGQFIFTTEANRTVSVHSAGMMEALKDLYRAKRLSDELKEGKIK